MEKQEKLTLPEILDDLSCRFIINLPLEELESTERVCFHIELAHWFYVDFYRSSDKTLPSWNLKEFARQLFEHCPILRPHLRTRTVEDILATFMHYKVRVPVCGGIILNPHFDKVLLVKGFGAKGSWGFPKGKINEDEPEIQCAAREVLEETGIDLTDRLRDEDFVELTLQEQRIRLYIVCGVDERTPVAPRTRNEISKIEWIAVEDLPMPGPAKEETRKSIGSFWKVAPFVPRIKQFIKKRRFQDFRFGRPQANGKGAGKVARRAAQQSTPESNGGGIGAAAAQSAAYTPERPTVSPAEPDEEATPENHPLLAKLNKAFAEFEQAGGSTRQLPVPHASSFHAPPGNYTQHYGANPLAMSGSAITLSGDFRPPTLASMSEAHSPYGHAAGLQPAASTPPHHHAPHYPPGGVNAAASGASPSSGQPPPGQPVSLLALLQSSAARSPAQPAPAAAAPADSAPAPAPHPNGFPVNLAALMAAHSQAQAQWPAAPPPHLRPPTPAYAGGPEAQHPHHQRMFSEPSPIPSYSEPATHASTASPASQFLAMLAGVKPAASPSSDAPASVSDAKSASSNPPHLRRAPTYAEAAGARPLSGSGERQVSGPPSPIPQPPRPVVEQHAGRSGSPFTSPPRVLGGASRSGSVSSASRLSPSPKPPLPNGYSPASAPSAVVATSVPSSRVPVKVGAASKNVYVQKKPTATFDQAAIDRAFEPLVNFKFDREAIMNSFMPLLKPATPPAPEQPRA